MATWFGRKGGARSGASRSWGRRIATWLAKGLLGFVALSLLFVALYKVVPVPVTPTMIMDPNGFSKDWTRLSSIDRNMVAAVIAGEDAKFCTHHGFDTDAIEQAWQRNQRGGRIRGGSTISQQTAKNVFLWQGGGFFRKGLEAWFTVLIEHIWGKRRIMEVYLNVAEMGPGVYGAEAAARKYFKTDAAHLSPDQAARLVAVLPNPIKYKAGTPGKYVRGRAAHIGAAAGTVRRAGLAECVL